MKKLVTLFAAAAVLLPVTAHAQNRAVDRDTYQQRMESRFAELDADGDGVWGNAEIVALLESQEERRAERAGEQARPVRPRRVERWLDGKDTDGDGALSLAEYVAERLAKFDEQDADGNGVLEPSERG